MTMWVPTINRDQSPIIVSKLSPSVPKFAVQCSLKILLLPIINLLFSPRYFKSCGTDPIEL